MTAKILELPNSSNWSILSSWSMLLCYAQESLMYNTIPILSEPEAVIDLNPGISGVYVSLVMWTSIVSIKSIL